MTTGYFRHLAFNLRLREYEEDDVARIVVRAEAIVAASGRAPDEVLGPVDDYAASFPKRAHRRRDKRLYERSCAVVAVLGAAYLIARLLIPAVDFGWRVGVYGTGLMCVLVSLGFFAWDWRAPSPPTDPTRSTPPDPPHRSNST